MCIIAFFATLPSVSINDLNMYYVLCIFPGSKKDSKLNAKAGFHCVSAGLEHSEILKGPQCFSETGAGSLFKQPLKIHPDVVLSGGEGRGGSKGEKEENT